MIEWLDGVVGKLTMYRLVIVCLAAFGLLSTVFSLLGTVRPGDALAMPVSAAVLVATSYLANRLFALIFRVRPHTDSTIITALLLFFILPPTLDPLGLGALALAALIAVASKYLLAIRGRHILNPAAAGAFGIGLTGLSFGQWWVGTAWLLPFVVLGGFLILFRTRRLPMGGVYLGVVVATGIVVYSVLGVAIDQAVYFTLVTSPYLFFAGFMLSEPLTLPPRRWQQLVYAAVIALLTAIPFSLGPLYNSPELALLIGNVLAFLVGQRRGIRLDFLGRRQLSASNWEFEFRPLRPVRFAAGQFAELTLPHPGTDTRGWRRVFSIASGPADDTVRFGIRLPERSSSFKRALLDLAPGTRVHATAVGGDFTLPSDPARPLLLVAGGIGVTPFVAHLAAIRDETPTRDVAVVYAVSSPDELAYADELRSAGCSVAIASTEHPADLPAGWTWIGPERLSGDTLLAAVPDAARRDAYVSGPPAMAAALRRALRRAGVRRVHTDVFVGY